MGGMDYNRIRLKTNSFKADVTKPCGTTRFQKKKRPKIRSKLTLQFEHVLTKVPVKRAAQTTKQATRGDDRAGTQVQKPERLENS